MALLLRASVDPDLAAAEKAFDDGAFEHVLPAIERALTKPLSPPDHHRALELQASAYAAFDDTPRAVLSFRKLLAEDPGYQLARSAGPKLKSMWEQALALGPSGPVLTPVDRPPPLIPSAEEGPPLLAKKWWVWAAAATVTVAVLVGGFSASRVHLPPGNLAGGELH